MITTHAVNYIYEKLVAEANNNKSEWGFDTDTPPDTPAGKRGLFIMLYGDDPYKDNADVTNNPDKDGIMPLAVSTRIPAGIISQLNDGNSKPTKTIKIENVPYTQTISCVTDDPLWKDGNNYKKAKYFALAEGTVVDDPVTIIDGSGNEINRYILDTSKTIKIIFEGSITNEQTIEPQNSFALTNIAIKFNDN